MASSTDVFARASNGTRPVPTTLTATLASGSSPGTASCAALTGWPTTTKVHFCIYTINTSGAKVAGSQTDWVGVVSGTTITGLTLKAGTNTGYSVGAVVEASPIAAYADDLFSGLTAQHSAVDGSHTAITATSLVASGAVSSGGVAISDLVTSWIPGSGTWTYISATTFTVPAADIANMVVGTKLRLTQTTTKYFYVGSVSGTTVTIVPNADYTFANAVVTSPSYSNAAAVVGFPQWFNYTPTTVAGFGTPPTATYRYLMIGRTVTVNSYRTNNPASNASSYWISPPITPRSDITYRWQGTCSYQNNSSDSVSPGYATIVNGGTQINLYRDYALATWTASGNKGADFEISYEA